MTTDIARFEQEIAVERAALLANLALLEDRARALTDWRQQVRKRPLQAVGVAAAGGVLLALMAGRRRSPVSAAPAPDGADEARPRPHPIVDRIVSALAVVAAERVFAALGTAFPSLADTGDRKQPSPAPAREP
ncbi:MAG: hypothetical protein ACYC7F_02560 [Gemmatimonadaceae bacterium]